MAEGFIFKNNIEPNGGSYRYIKEIITESCEWAPPPLKKIKNENIIVTVVGGGAAGTASRGGGGGYISGPKEFNYSSINNNINIKIGLGELYNNTSITRNNMITSFGNILNASGANGINGIARGGSNFNHGSSYIYNNTTISGGNRNYLSSSSLRLVYYNNASSSSIVRTFNGYQNYGSGGGASYGPGGDAGQDGINGSGGGSYGNGGNGLCIIEYWVSASSFYNILYKTIN